MCVSLRQEFEQLLVRIRTLESALAELSSPSATTAADHEDDTGRSGPEDGDKMDTGTREMEGGGEEEKKEEERETAASIIPTNLREHSNRV